MKSIKKLREMDRGYLIPYGNGDYRPDTRHGQIADEIEHEITELQEGWAQEAREHADDSAKLAELAHENAKLKREIAEKYMELPVDADGVPIHIGDELETAHGAKMIVEYVGEREVRVYLDGEHYRISQDEYAYTCRHVKHDPVKELLEEFVREHCTGNELPDHGNPVYADYAAKIREAVNVVCNALTHASAEDRLVIEVHFKDEYDPYPIVLNRLDREVDYMEVDSERYERVRECELEHHDTGWVSCRECNTSWKNDRPHVYRRCPYCGARVKEVGGDD